MNRLPMLTAGMVVVLCAAATPAAEVRLQQHDLAEPWAAGVIHVADLDGDQDPDVVAVTETGLNLAENADRRGKFTIQLIEATSSPANIAHSADLDGDGDRDLVTHAAFWGGDVDWLSNSGKGKPWQKHALLTSDVGRDIKALILSDVDGDNDVDLLFAGRGAGCVANADKAVRWQPPAIIGDITSNVLALVCADFDGDQDNDVVAADESSRELIYVENSGQAWSGRRPLQKFDNSIYLPSTLQAVDFDNDGDLDIFAVPQSNEALLYGNSDGKGSFSNKVLAGINNLVLAKPADFDGDGDPDIIAACRNAAEGIVWLENENGQFAKRHQVSADWERPTLLEAVDFDLDGDLDIVSVSNDIEGKRTAWWENLRK